MEKRGLKRVLKCVAVCLVTAVAFGALPVAAALTAAYDDSVTVVVDAGHGGADGGVTGKDTGVKESDLNLIMAKLVGEFLESGGYDVVYTRKGSGGLYRATDSNKKSADMQRRGEIIREADAAAVISIHMNTFHQRSRRGAQVFFDKSSEQGRALAEAVQRGLNTEFNLPDAGREFAPLAADKYILRQSAAPAVIVECGFLSNPSDEAHLLDADYRARLAYAIFIAVDGFLSEGA